MIKNVKPSKSNVTIVSVFLLYGWAMPQKLLLNNFEQMKGTSSQFNEDFIKEL